MGPESMALAPLGTAMLLPLKPPSDPGPVPTWSHIQDSLSSWRAFVGPRFPTLFTGATNQPLAGVQPYLPNTQHSEQLLWLT